jgi:hypothetical protein
MPKFLILNTQSISISFNSLSQNGHFREFLRGFATKVTTKRSIDYLFNF